MFSLSAQGFHECATVMQRFGNSSSNGSRSSLSGVSAGGSPLPCVLSRGTTPPPSRLTSHPHPPPPSPAQSTYGHDEQQTARPAVAARHDWWRWRCRQRQGRHRRSSGQPVDGIPAWNPALAGPTQDGRAVAAQQQSQVAGCHRDRRTPARAPPTLSQAVAAATDTMMCVIRAR